MRITGIDIDGDVMLDDGRYVNPQTGKASRKDYVRTTFGSGVSGVETWKDAEITAEELAELAKLYVAYKEEEAAKDKAEEAARKAEREAYLRSPERLAKRAEAIRSVRRFFTAKQVPDDMIPDRITMSYDKFDIEVAIWPECE